MPIIHESDFKAWEACVPTSLREDHMWKFHAYRVALYLLDLAGARRAGAASEEMFSSPNRSAVESGFIHQRERRGRIRPRLGGGSLTLFRHRTRLASRKLHLVPRRERSIVPPETVDLRFEQLAELRRILVGAQKWLATKPHKSQLM